MIRVVVTDPRNRGCSECGVYPDDKLIRVQLVFPHAKADLCVSCINKLQGMLNEVILDPGQVEVTPDA